MSAAPSLHVVEETGEVIECPTCAQAEAKASRLERDMGLVEKELRRQRGRVDDLLQRQHKDLRAHPLHAIVARLFEYWQGRCDHEKAVLDDDRVKLGLDRLNDLTKKGPKAKRRTLEQAEAELREAIDGAAEDPFIDKKGKCHDSFDLIFRNMGKVEDFRKRVAGRGRPSAVKGLRVEGVVEAQLLVSGLELLNDERLDGPHDALAVTFDPDVPNVLRGFCPVCDDPLRTLTVEYGLRGRATVDCRNGCDHRAVRTIVEDEAKRAARRRGLQVAE